MPRMVKRTCRRDVLVFFFYCYRRIVREGMCDCSLGKRCKKIAKEIRGGEKESLQAESHMVERLAKKTLR